MVPAMQPTLSLAVFDLVPVIIAGVAFVTLARLITAKNPDLAIPAMAGAVLATTGGASKAIWKVIKAASDGDIDITVMEEALFPLLSVGFALMAMSLFLLREEGKPLVSGLVLVGIIWGIAVGLSFVSEGAVNGYFITVVTLAEVTLIMLLWRWARREGAHIGWLLGFHLFLVIGLSGMARAVEQTNALQWVEESANAVTQALLLVAVFRLKDAITARTTETADVT